MNFDYTNTIVNLSNSILKKYGVKPFHNSIKKIDDVIAGKNKICVMLFDGLGSYIIRKHLKKDSIMRKNYFMTINATYPPTTVASTTGFLSGKFPIETGWLGWGVYMEEYNANISCFMNERVKDRVLVKDKEDNIMSNICHYDTIFELIKKHNKDVSVLDEKCYPCYPDGPKSLKEAKKRLDKFFKDNQKAFAYFYWTKPDDEIHEYGVDSFEAHYEIEQINLFVRNIVKDNPDTLFISIADHGLIDIKYLDMLEHPDLVDTFLHEPGLEVRVNAFYIKEDRKEEFEELFNKYYGKYFVLMDNKTALKKGVFGFGKPHHRSIGFLGDYISIAIDKYGLYMKQTYGDYTPKEHIGHHAGYTKEEQEIDISIYNLEK